MSNSITIPNNPATAAQLVDLKCDGHIWVVAADGQWKAHKSLTEAVISLGKAPSDGIILASEDFSVDSTFGYVRADTVHKVELSEEEMKRLMYFAAHDAAVSAQSLVDFIDETCNFTGLALNTSEAEGRLLDLSSDLEEYI